MAYSRKTVWIVSMLCLVFINETVWGYNKTDVVELKKYLLGQYDPSVRPILNQSRSLHISLHFALTNLIQIDMMNGQMEGVGYIVGIWEDDGLSWAGTQYDVIPRLTFSGDEIWTPDVEQFDAIGEEVKKVAVIVEKNGTVIWAVSRRYTTFCVLNMRYYPRDEHVCHFEFVSARYPFSEVDLNPVVGGADLSEMRMHGEWELIDSSVTLVTKRLFGQGIRGVIYSITFGRQPDFIFVHKLVPLLLLAISYLFVHIVPLNSGERVSYAVTVLLAFVFWQAIITEDLPNNSAKISFMSVIMTVCMGLSTASTVISVALCRLADCNEDHQKPKLLVALAKRLRWNRNSYSVSRYGSRISKRSSEEGQSENGGKDGDDGGHPGTEEQEVTWLEVANAVDLIALLILILLTLVLVIIFIVVYVARVGR